MGVAAHGNTIPESCKKRWRRQVATWYAIVHIVAEFLVTSVTHPWTKHYKKYC